MPRYRGKLYLTAEMKDEYSISALWPDIGHLDITMGSTYNYITQSQYQVFTIEEQNVQYGAWNTTKIVTYQQGLWDAFGSTISGASASTFFDTNPKITPTLTMQAIIEECGLNYDSDKGQFFDYRNSTLVGNPNAKIYNPFIIGKKPNSNTYICLCFVYNGSYETSINIGVELRAYTETRDAQGNRVSWDYGSQTQPGAIFSGSFPDTTTSGTFDYVGKGERSEFTNICLASGYWGSLKGRFIVFGVNDSGEPQVPINNETGRKFSVIFISDTCFSDELEEIPDYGPEPEGTGTDGFKKSDVSKSGNSATMLSDNNPYGLNNAQTGHVILGKTNYYQLLGSIFGRNFQGSYNGTPNITDPNTQGIGYNPYEVNDYYAGQGLLAPEQYQSGETQSSSRSLSDSLGITKEIREAMTSAILSIQIFPDLFTGYSDSISTIAGYSLNSTISCSAVSNEIVYFDTYATITRPYASFIGYEPFTSVSIFAPFIGVINISPSVLFDADTNRYGSANVRLHYIIDSLTGLCSCEVRIGNPEYTYCVKQGCCSSSIPIIGSGKSGEGTKNLLSGFSSITGGLMSFASGNIFGGAYGLATGAMQMMRGEAMSPLTTPIVGSSTANIAALLSPKTPMWFMSYKNPAMPQPNEYDSILGGMTNQHGTISHFSGYCEFYDVNLSSVTATQAVKDQILQRLRGGVIV